RSRPGPPLLLRPPHALRGATATPSLPAVRGPWARGPRARRALLHEQSGPALPRARGFPHGRVATRGADCAAWSEEFWAPPRDLPRAPGEAIRALWSAASPPPHRARRPGADRTMTGRDRGRGCRRRARPRRLPARARCRRAGTSRPKADRRDRRERRRRPPFRRAPRPRV